MIFNFGFGDNPFVDILQLDIEIYIEDQLATRQTISAPFEMARLQYMQLVQQLAEINDGRRVKMICTETKDIQINEWETITKPVKLIYTNER